MQGQMTINIPGSETVEEKDTKVYQNPDREKYLNILREKLPELKSIEGFPLGNDEDILALSDPPYYTACPNPFIDEFIKKWEWEKHLEHHSDGMKDADGNIINQDIFSPSKCPLCVEKDKSYSREPYSADVSEGKNHPIYNAHSYHTKVPHKAIMRYILHYTEPGDVIFDGFCGTGMTGVAAQMCGDKSAVEELGFRVEKDGTILQEVEEDGKKSWKPFSRLGARKAVLNDLSPAATFIAYNYNTPVDVKEFEREAKRILAEVEKECGWMYETPHTVDGKIQKDNNGEDIKGKINYTVWSDVFVCPECTGEVVFWNEAVDKTEGKVRDTFKCPHCNKELTKRNMERAWESKYDKLIDQTVRQSKQVPVLINYSLDKKRFEKEPDRFDVDLIKKIEDMDIPYWVPAYRMPEGDESRRNDRIGITHVHHFYTKRNLWVLGYLWEKASPLKMLKLSLTSVLMKTASKLHNIGLKNGNINLAGALPNSLYIPSNIAERNIYQLVSGKIDDFLKIPIDLFEYSSIILVSHTNNNQKNDRNNIPINKIDYIFTDPPFGGNLMYSELNFIWESWLKVFTNNKSEAIENRVQGKGLHEYQKLMEECFREYYRVLKPGRWMTVEFSNTSPVVWNLIQEALQRAGFVVADVSVLNKGQGTYNAQTTLTAVKKDLVISAYKPVNGLAKKLSDFTIQGEDTAWEFMNMHLKMLPIMGESSGKGKLIEERTPRSLFDRMVAYHVQRGLPVPLSSGEFQEKVVMKFPERDGMVFLPDQVNIYEKKKLTMKEFMEYSIFVEDEKSAIEWLRQRLIKKTQTYQDIVSDYMKELQHIDKKEKMPELIEILEQSFLEYSTSDYEKKSPVPRQILSYLRGNYAKYREMEENDPAVLKEAKGRWYVPDPNKALDLQKIRDRELLKEFNEIVEKARTLKKKIKSERMEALRCGFRNLWDMKDYKSIVEMGEKLAEDVLAGDQDILMYYDNASVKVMD